MTYAIEFEKNAHKKFEKLHPQIAEQFIRKLEALLKNPKIRKNKLSGLAELYRIKLKAAGYRLVYKVKDDTKVIFIIDVDRRDTIYKYL